MCSEKIEKTRLRRAIRSPGSAQKSGSSGRQSSIHRPPRRRRTGLGKGPGQAVADRSDRPIGARTPPSGGDGGGLRRVRRSTGHEGRPYGRHESPPFPQCCVPATARSLHRRGAVRSSPPLVGTGRTGGTPTPAAGGSAGSVPPCPAPTGSASGAGEAGAPPRWPPPPGASRWSTCCASASSRCASRSGWASTGTERARRVLHGAAGQRRLPHRRPRAGEVVRRRHRAEGVASTTRTRSGCGGRRCSGTSAPGPPLHRFRTGLEFAFGGHREVDDMLAQHARLAQALAEAGPAREVVDALAGSYERWDGEGWPGGRRRRIPLASRHRAAGRVRRGRPPRRRRRGGAWRWRAARRHAVRPDLVRSSAPPRRDLRPTSTRSATWDAVIEAEPALAVVLSGDEIDAALRAIADFVDLKSPVHPGPRPRRGRPRRRGAAARAARPTSAAAPRAGWCTTSAASGCRTRSGTSRGPLGAGEWERVRLHPYFTERMLSSPRARAARRDRRAAPRAARRLRLPRGLPGGAIPPPRGCSPPPTPTRRCASRARTGPPAPPTRPPPSCGPRSRRPPRRRRRRGGARRGRPPRPAPPRRARPGLTAREVEVLRLLARGLSNKRDRRAARHLPEDRRQPRRAHLREDRRLEPGDGRPVRHAARPACPDGEAAEAT